MACFVAPMTAAAIATKINKKITKKYHFEWLLFMLWGGSAMLIVDHIANGEIVTYFPFFTRSWHQIWTEVLHIGIPMTAVAILLWATMVWISIGLEKRNALNTI